jgi:hypothetical protein
MTPTRACGRAMAAGPGQRLANLGGRPGEVSVSQPSNLPAAFWADEQRMSVREMAHGGGKLT